MIKNHSDDEEDIKTVGREGLIAWALRIRSLHGFPLSPLRSDTAATACIDAATAAALCAASMARIVANSRRRAAT